MKNVYIISYVLNSKNTDALEDFNNLKNTVLICKTKLSFCRSVIKVKKQKTITYYLLLVRMDKALHTVVACKYLVN